MGNGLSSFNRKAAPVTGCLTHEGLLKRALEKKAKHYREQLAKNPKDAQALVGLADCLLKGVNLVYTDLQKTRFAKFSEEIEECIGLYMRDKAEQAAEIPNKNRLRIIADLYKGALECDPNNVQAIIGLAGSLIYQAKQFAKTPKENLLKQATDLYRSALGFDPNNVQAMLGLADCLIYQARQFGETPKENPLKQAAGLYRSILKCDPNAAEALNNLAVCLEWDVSHEESDFKLIEGYTNIKQDELRKADLIEHLYRKALTIKPDYKAAKDNLTAFCTESIEEAAKKAFDKNLADTEANRMKAFVTPYKPIKPIKPFKPNQRRK